MTRKKCNPCGFTMDISSNRCMLLIYDAKRNTEIGGIGPFDSSNCYTVINNYIN